MSEDARKTKVELDQRFDDLPLDQQRALVTPSVAVRRYASTVRRVLTSERTRVAA